MFKKRKKGEAKYGNKKTYCSLNHPHRSKKEARYCDKLLAQENDREIRGFQVELPFELQGKARIKGELLRPITYKADFVIVHNDNSIEIIDVKGWRTEVFKIKWKMLKYKYKDKPNYKFTLV